MNTAMAMTEIQSLLNAAGDGQLRVDGVLGPMTAAALRRFQAAHGLAPDGAADGTTQDALRRAVGGVAALRLSEAGQRFLYGHEAQRGVSNRLYWPGGSSGVTLGAGYDMKERDAASIECELAGLGLQPEACRGAGAGAGLAGVAAENFAATHAALVCLTEAQEMALMVAILPPYEGIVRQGIRVTLAQHQFDALVSFAYNPGGSFGDVAGLINAGDTDAALTRMRRRVFSGRRRLDDLVRRRSDETQLYLTGRY